MPGAAPCTRQLQQIALQRPTRVDFDFGWLIRQALVYSGRKQLHKVPMLHKCTASASAARPCLHQSQPLAHAHDAQRTPK